MTKYLPPLFAMPETKLKFITHAGLTAAYIEGQQMGESLMTRVKTCHAHPDELFLVIRSMLLRDLDALTATKLRGVMRTLQKHAEGATA